MYDELHDGGPFRGAILNGEGAVYYNIKIHIKHLIDELNGTFVQENGNLEVLKDVAADITLQDYLSDNAEKIFPFLLKKYRNAKPKILANLVIALDESGFLKDSDLIYPAKLIKAIGRSFNRNLSKQSLSYHLDRKNSIDEEKKIIRTKMVKEIEKEIEKESNSLALYS